MAAAAEIYSRDAGIQALILGAAWGRGSVSSENSLSSWSARCSRPAPGRSEALLRRLRQPVAEEARATRSVAKRTTGDLAESARARRHDGRSRQAALCEANQDRRSRAEERVAEPVLIVKRAPHTRRGDRFKPAHTLHTFHTSACPYPARLCMSASAHTTHPFHGSTRPIARKQDIYSSHLLGQRRIFRACGASYVCSCCSRA
jgi:hypothetical protein